jgi:hypothetical protein
MIDVNNIIIKFILIKILKAKFMKSFNKFVY